VYKAAHKIMEVIRRERSAGREVLINVSGSMRTLGIACYIAGCMTNTKVYATLSRYDEAGRVIGVEKTYAIPIFKLKKPPPERMEILRALAEGEARSVEELIARLKPGLSKSTASYDNERARLSYHIRALREEGLVETERNGKNLRLWLTEKARMILQSQSYLRRLNAL